MQVVRVVDEIEAQNWNRRLAQASFSNPIASGVANSVHISMMSDLGDVMFIRRLRITVSPMEYTTAQLLSFSVMMWENSTQSGQGMGITNVFKNRYQIALPGDAPNTFFDQGGAYTFGSARLLNDIGRPMHSIVEIRNFILDPEIYYTLAVTNDSDNLGYLSFDCEYEEAVAALMSWRLSMMKG